MHIARTPLYPRSPVRVPLRVKLVACAVVLIAPLAAKGTDPAVPYEQNFLITAYYSPEDGQCCYVKGGVDADKVLNGQGIAGADGTPVYPGMIAAPSSYPFGTRIVLEGIGTFEVNDRGGAIRELADGTHRLDIWAGAGEEGLARALAFGLREVKGTVYPPSTDKPPVSFALETLPAPVDRLRQYLVRSDNLMAVKAELGDRGLSVAMLQDHLKSAGYFDGAATGFFGPETHDSLARFIRDHAPGQTADQLTPLTAARLTVAAKRGRPSAPVSSNVDASSSAKVVSEAQRILRHFGYYEGRTDGRYSDALFAAILRFQQDHALAGNETSPGAGRIGPLTMAALRDTWNTAVIADKADRHLLFATVGDTLEDRGMLPDRFLGMGSNGTQVALLQTILADEGFFPADEINGNFGPMTESSVIDYQIDRGIVASASDPAAGYVGPSTLSQLRLERQLKYYKLVRGEGWRAL